jgi:hypothetical protein
MRIAHQVELDSGPWYLKRGPVRLCDHALIDLIRVAIAESLKVVLISEYNTRTRTGVQSEALCASRTIHLWVERQPRVTVRSSDPRP